MKGRTIIIFLIALGLSAFSAHKFYVSVTNINYSKESSSFQITTRIFIDDLEALLKERYEIDAKLATDDELTTSNAFIEKYLRTKLAISLDGNYADYQFLGKKYDNDVVICYLEIENVELDGLKMIEVQNEILTDLFEEQKNLVHLKINGKKKSFVLIKGNNKGLLKL